MRVVTMSVKLGLLYCVSVLLYSMTHFWREKKREGGRKGHYITHIDRGISCPTGGKNNISVVELLGTIIIIKSQNNVWGRTL